MKRFINPVDLNDLRFKLREWFEQNRRHLPFRESRDPYQIWLSEIIMQQTRMEQGLPYYNKFIQAFPDVFSLARAEEDEVLKLWQGLGYYSRARNLLIAARQVTQEFNGVFPDNFRDLLRLKGVGPYTAAAIASMAFREPVATVDGNVQRVLARLFEMSEPVNTPVGSKEIENLATQFLDHSNPGMHNEAMMELGALICKPKQPDCNFCPLRSGCSAFHNHRTTHYPIKLPKSSVKPLYFIYVVIEQNQQILIRKRTETGIWHQLYEPPVIEMSSPPDQNEIFQITSNAFKHWPFQVQKPEWVEITHLKHQLTHRAISAHFVLIRTHQLEINTSEYVLASEHELLHSYALTRLFARFLESSDLWKKSHNTSNKKIL